MLQRWIARKPINSTRNARARKRIAFSVVAPTGVHHYFLPANFWLWGKVLAAGLAVVLVGGGYAILALSYQVTRLETKKQFLETKIAFMQEKNNSLVEVLNSKFSEVNAIGAKVNSIENVIGIEDNHELSISERMEVASMLIANREREMREIDHRLQGLEVLIGVDASDDGSSLTRRIDVAAMNASQKMIMLDNVPHGYPLAAPQTTSGFGYRVHPKLGTRAFHDGLDFRAKVGTPVMVVSDGVVSYAGYSSGGYGRMVEVRHNYGFNTVYAHLDSVGVSVGSFVKKGDIIGKSGNSGLSSGPHLHFEVSFVDTPLDPLNFVRWDLDNYTAVFEEKNVRWQSLLDLLTPKLTSPASPSLQLAQK